MIVFIILPIGLIVRLIIRSVKACGECCKRKEEGILADGKEPALYGAT